MPATCAIPSFRIETNGTFSTGKASVLRGSDDMWRLSHPANSKEKLNLYWRSYYEPQSWDEIVLGGLALLHFPDQRGLHEQSVQWQVQHEWMFRDPQIIGLAFSQGKFDPIRWLPIVFGKLRGINEARTTIEIPQVLQPDDSKVQQFRTLRLSFAPGATLEHVEVIEKKKE